MFKIIRCRKCGTPQYIRDTQKNRKCPRCDYNIQCSKAKIFGRADSETEASQIVRSMKTPSEIEQRFAILKSNLNPSPSNKYESFNQIITELLAVFPKAMPISMIFAKGKEIGLNQEFIEKVVNELHQAGLMIENSDFNGSKVLSFPSLPIKLNKIFIKKPLPMKTINKNLNRRRKNITKDNSSQLPNKD